MNVLVTGGVRSGKSAHAERLLAAEPTVTYVAAGPTYDDDDWHERIARHRAVRPVHWQTVESTAIADVLTETTGAVLVECLGTWVTAIVDEADLWEAPSNVVTAHVEELLGPVLAALTMASTAGSPVVLVTNEVGLGIVPDHRSGRLFRDLLGMVNQRVGAAVDEVHLVIAGRVLVLPS